MKLMSKIIMAITWSGLFCLGAAQGQGDPNLIKNGGFETGSLTDWTHLGTDGIVEVDKTYSALGPVVNPAANGGTYFAVLSPRGEEDSSLSQLEPGPAGLSGPVTLSFDYDLAGKALAANETPEEQAAYLNVTIGGVSLFDKTYNAAGGSALTTANAAGQTGWLTESVTLTPAEVTEIKNSGLDLEFSVNQAKILQEGFDFSASIDNVALNYSVPDGGWTILLFGGALSALVAAKRKFSTEGN